MSEPMAPAAPHRLLGIEVDDALAARLAPYRAAGRLSCAEAHQVATRQQCPPHVIGVALDLLEIRLAQCQLGLFGHGGDKPVRTHPVQLTPPLEQALAAATQEGGVTCAAAWEIAAARGLSRLDVAAAAECLGLRIRPCQLGAF